MLLAAAVAFWKGWQLHRGRMGVVAFLLGGLALAMAAWHFLHKAPGRRI